MVLELGYVKTSLNSLPNSQRRSYCAEAIMCYDNIEKYKSAKRKGNKYKIARHILNTYLVSGAPLELNINNIITRYDSLAFHINSQDDKKINEEMDILRTHCLQDMTEMMHRLILSNKEIKEMAFSTTIVTPFPTIPTTSHNIPMSIV